jgi:archaellum component FlaG (FlaF/FlaG flagellin family)
VKVADEIPGFLGAKASGKFVIVSITVTNVKQESIQFGTGDFTLIVNGNSIDVDDNTFALDDGFSYDDLSPGLTKKGRIEFDVAPADAGTGVLKAQAQLSLDDAVYLSLK